MKLITTWHCIEILQGEERDTTPREWLILAGPGEDLIFEVKTASRPTNRPKAGNEALAPTGFWHKADIRTRSINVRYRV
jgi:hypothetical protein